MTGIIRSLSPFFYIAMAKEGHKLHRLMIFNPDYGPGEGQELQRLLFYHPEEDSDEVKAQNVGFAQATYNFCKVEMFTTCSVDNV